MPKQVDLDAEMNAARRDGKPPRTGLLLAIGLVGVAGFLLLRAFVFGPPSAPKVSPLERETKINLQSWLESIDEYTFANDGRFPAVNDLREAAIRGADPKASPIPHDDTFAQSPHDAGGEMDVDYAIHQPPAGIGVTPAAVPIVVVVDLAAAKADPPVLAVGLLDGSLLYAEDPSDILFLLEVPENAWLIEATGLSREQFEP